MRFQYVFWVILILAACLAIWLTRPPRVRIESYLFVPSDDSDTASVSVQEAMNAAGIVKSDDFIDSILSDPSIAQAELLKSVPAPAQWLKVQLTVSYDKQVGTPAIALVVAESHEQDAKRLVDQIVNEFTRRTLADQARAAEQRRSELEAEFQALSAKAKHFVDASRGGVEVSAAESAKFESIRNRLEELSLQLEEMDLDVPERIRIQQGMTVTKLGRW
jgi:hypothetical protein